MTRLRMLAILISAAFPLWSWSTELQIYAQAEGHGLDVVREIQRRIGDTNEIRIVPWARAYHLVEHDPNVAVIQVVRTPSRDALFQWVGPFDHFSSELFAPPQSNLSLKSIEDAKKVPHIGVARDSYLDQELTKLGFTNLDRQPSLALAILQMKSNRIDAVASDTVTMRDFIEAGNLKKGDIKSVLRIMSASNYIMFSKDMPANIVMSWQAALEAMKADGTFARLYGVDTRRQPNPATAAPPEPNAPPTR